ncbi:MAG: Fic family protein [Gemmatimonadota bacterium]
MGDRNSHAVTVFQGRRLPEPARLAGYAALLQRYELPVPLPGRLAGIAERHRKTDTSEWLLLTPRHAPADTLEGQLEFALKWEGVDLPVLNQLFRVVDAAEVAAVIRNKPTGRYARRLWFLYEWLTGEELDVPEPGKVRSVLVVDPGQQYAAASGPRSSRHRVMNNLPGPREFCPLVRRTEELERLRAMGLEERARAVIGRTHPDVVARAAAFLLLSDSRASFSIEGEQPSHDRATRWGRAIAEAGSVPLGVEELERLQRTVIGDDRFVRLGLREEGGFVGAHDRLTGEPLPDHVSARPADLRGLLGGLAAYVESAIEAGMDPVVVAASAAFGFVYIHPFEDGNGRVHRWLIHHVLAAAGYGPTGVVFPISASILRHVSEYRRVLESYSLPLLGHIQWRPTPRGNVEVLNDTADYYRYVDVTAHAEFLYRRVAETVATDLPQEVAYLEAYDRFRSGVQQVVDMPERTLDLLHRFLHEGGGRLSKRAREGEFQALTADEVPRFERLYAECFTGVAESAGHADEQPSLT